MFGPVSTYADSVLYDQPDPTRLPTHCQSVLELTSQRQSSRGVAIGRDIVEKVQKDRKFFVLFDEIGLWKAIGKNTKYFDSAVGLHIRDICDPHYNAWKDMPEEHKRRIQNRMLKKSVTNQQYRDSQKWSSFHGRKSYSQYRFGKAQMEVERTTQMIQSDGECSSTAVNEERIMSQVLGKRRGHTKRVGPTLSQRNCSSASTSLSASQSNGSSLVNLPQHVKN
ncbi:uncharacterized protein LOC112092874 [Morus notabilis]|uniref:uncharacterized protein LOC112092874 n=1 Tax=Morus notabilis TaxID=981085 RepID=UPI000CED412B|nr:uncharacterized protein LOC112092874 [Morus notabilis]